MERKWGSVWKQYMLGNPDPLLLLIPNRDPQALLHYVDMTLHDLKLKERVHMPMSRNEPFGKAWMAEAERLPYLRDYVAQRKAYPLSLMMLDRVRNFATKYALAHNPLDTVSMLLLADQYGFIDIQDFYRFILQHLKHPCVLLLDSILHDYEITLLLL